MSTGRNGPGESSIKSELRISIAEDSHSVVCINGHRAPKCNHFDRYMMRVRNPGRPLIVCPHIETSTECDCKPREAVIMMKVHKGECSPESAILASIQSIDQAKGLIATAHVCPILRRNCCQHISSRVGRGTSPPQQNDPHNRLNKQVRLD